MFALAFDALLFTLVSSPFLLHFRPEQRLSDAPGVVIEYPEFSRAFEFVVRGRGSGGGIWGVVWAWWFYDVLPATGEVDMQAIFVRTCQRSEKDGGM